MLGYVIRHRAELGDPFTFEVYADARNDQGQRIRIRREHSLNTAVAWMVQHSAELIAFAARSRSDSRLPAETTASERASADVDQARELSHVERGQLARRGRRVNRHAPGVRDGQQLGQQEGA
ncbi:hypothetical protein [Clavibacter michiganensis]|uniref:hypothetical protein n=1 Tax=Clavibacter michiganensis TaxID=28447 RepID=UPI0026DCD13C|nr:hypothetical protein [Clavibacter michiganensis]MDO4144203.1 hypothetical protein [Clavibacter michiganensis]